MKLKDCPFCQSSDIRYSVKKSTSQFLPIYHAAFYCWDCNAYGPRVLCKPGEIDRYRRDIKNDIALKHEAAEKWNSRKVTIEHE